MAKNALFGRKILKTYVNEVSPSGTVTDSYNRFVHKQIDALLMSLKDIECVYHVADGTTKELKLTILDHTIRPPVRLEADSTSRPSLPNECRDRNLTYSSPLYVQMEVTRKWKGKVTTNVINDIYIGKIPVMIYSDLCHLRDKEKRVKSKECGYDPGGYFIIDGKEKTLIGQRSHVMNRFITYKSKRSSAVAVKSEMNYRTYITTIKFTSGRRPLTVTFPHIEEEIPVMTLLIALGISVEDIHSSFTEEENVTLSASFIDLPKDMNEARARIKIRQVYYLHSDSDDKFKIVFERMLLPHIPVNDDGSYLCKSIFILKMIKKLLLVESGAEEPTDRDSVINQRVQMSYTLLTKMFYNLLLTWSELLKKEFNKYIAKLKNPISMEKIRNIIDHTNCITDGFSYALATGNWNTNSVDRQALKGVAQQLPRMSYIATLSQLRRVSSALDPEMKNPKPRFLHSSHYGRLCPCETPEGATVGLECVLAIGALVSLHSDPKSIIEVTQQYLLSISLKNSKKGDDVFVNGDYMGNTKKGKVLLKTLRNARRSGQFPKDMSVSKKRRTIHISTTAGRICRPLLIVDKGKLPYNESMDLSWDQLLRQGYIEYLDAEEENNESYIAFYPSQIVKTHTHCEITNIMMLGINASTIPFAHHNPSPRNTFQSAMKKQAMGASTTNFQDRLDTAGSNILWYGQSPLVRTVTSDLFKIDSMDGLPAGCNIICAIMPKHGYGQEDSVIFKKEAIERGLFRADHYTVVQDMLTKNTKEESVYSIPKKHKKMGKYDQLTKDGIIEVGSKIQARHCLIGKKMVRKVKHQPNLEEDQSILADVNHGYVEKVRLFQGKNGQKGVKIKIRTQQVPKIGDKFSSRHGQKGTIGMIYPEVDLPFTMDGITPDIIVNPHAIPSRMTIAHLKESLASLLTAVTGAHIDASAFGDVSVDSIAEMLHKAGFNRHGNQTMMNGETGEMMQAQIFMCPIFYQRLKHMVDYKKHARGRGRRNALTKQPNEGRRNKGGLRFGEMEKDTTGTHGCPVIIQDRMLHCSDVHTIFVCPKCQQPSLKEGCRVCNTATVKKEIPYAANLLFQELKSMCIDVKMKV